MQNMQNTTQGMEVLNKLNRCHLRGRSQVKTSTLDTLDIAGSNKTDAEKDLPLANQHGSGTWVHACFHNVTAMVYELTMAPLQIIVLPRSISFFWV